MVDYVSLFESGYDPSPVYGDDTATETPTRRLWPEGEALTPVDVPTGASLCAHLGWPADDPETLALCQRHVSHVTALAHSRCRGRGFSLRTEPAKVAADLSEVILSAAARSVADPTGARRIEVGAVVTSPTPFVGFTLAEQGVLKRYRPMVG